jgi:hypothetical protein
MFKKRSLKMSNVIQTLCFLCTCTVAKTNFDRQGHSSAQWKVL